MKSLYLKASNYALYLFLCALAGMGFALEYRLPRGGESRGLALLGLRRHDWAEIHAYTAIAFVAIMMVHLWLNRAWIVKAAARKDRTVLFASLGLGLLLLAAPLLAPIRGLP